MSAGSPPGVRIVRYDGPEAEERRVEVLAVYEAAWADTPFAPTRSQLLDFDAVVDRHTTRPNFRLVAAVGGGGAMTGFAYGYTSEPGGWWRDVVVEGLDARVIREWFSDCFEFVELAVHPSAQGTGVGARLHDALLEGVRHRTAVLSTQTENHRARRLYSRRGWVVLDSGFVFPNRPYPYTIMGLELDKRLMEASPDDDLSPDGGSAHL